MKTLTRCPVCGSDRIRHDYTAPTTRGMDETAWRVDACDACSLGFMNPQPSWEELAPYYSATYSPYEASHGGDAEDDRTVERARREGEFRHVKIEPGLRLLDVGCGGGYFPRIARRLGAEVQGVEPSANGAATARAAGLPVFEGTVESYAEAHPEAKFDLITANHVLEHVPEPVETLRVMGRLLAPGGTVWIGVPNAACAFSRAMPGRWHSVDLPYHLMQFTPESLALAGREAGLEVVGRETYSYPPSTGASIRQLLRRKYKVPARLTMRIGAIDSRLAPRVGRRYDAKGLGEAILIRYGLRGDATR